MLSQDTHQLFGVIKQKATALSKHLAKLAKKVASQDSELADQKQLCTQILLDFKQVQTSVESSTHEREAIEKQSCDRMQLIEQLKLQLKDQAQQLQSHQKASSEIKAALGEMHGESTIERIEQLKVDSRERDRLIVEL